MGSYATLMFGHFSMGEFKSHIPLEPLLLFTREDYREEPRSDGEEELVERKFVVSASVAKNRADARGLTIEVCQRLFEDFRVDRFWNFSLTSGREWSTKNKVSFRQYLDACKYVFKKHTSWYLEFDDKKISNRIRRIFSEGFFADDVEYYFQEAHYCILMRAFLEVIPPNTEITLDFSDLVWGQYLDLDGVDDVYGYFMQTLVQRVGLHYQLYGFLFENDPDVERRLRKRLDELSEDQFIEHVLLPLFDKMGFQRVQKVDFHGPNEFGSDVRPFRYVTPLGTLEYYAAQAKAVGIHGSSGKDGNAGELISQATQAFSVAFVDDIDNERKFIDKFIVATTKTISPGARHAIEGAVEGKRSLIFWDSDAIVALMKKHGLVQYLLFTQLA